MKKFVVSAAAVASLAAGGLALASSAAAIPLTGNPADQAVRVLEAEGYTVRINQTVDVPLSSCSVTGVSGLRGAEENGVLRDPGSLNVAFLDVNCPPRS
ncbi:hypothetical protein [Mycobacterium sp. URHB0044]|jgi:hypothetical protein|uniref:hypothetical protein n=1 Tax=Mycobacterium sp. URHB0044 TaxID=1380386 RepID=UPI000683FD5B|nr:hypothetical protein [Mycobacterium sp. URHB0044]